MWLKLSNTYMRVSIALKLIHAHCKTKCFGEKIIHMMKNLIIQTLRNNAIKKNPCEYVFHHSDKTSV
jgi:hypothetical protein